MGNNIMGKNAQSKLSESLLKAIATTHVEQHGKMFGLLDRILKSMSNSSDNEVLWMVIDMEPEIREALYGKEVE